LAEILELTKEKHYFCVNNITHMTNREYIITTIKKHRSELSKYGIKEVGLFGSYSREEQSTHSDIDILIDFEKDRENYDNYMAVFDIFEKIFKNEKVEVVTKNGLSPYIGPRILNEVLYVLRAT